MMRHSIAPIWCLEQIEALRDSDFGHIVNFPISQKAYGGVTAAGLRCHPIPYWQITQDLQPTGLDSAANALAGKSCEPNDPMGIFPSLWRDARDQVYIEAVTSRLISLCEHDLEIVAIGPKDCQLVTALKRACNIAGCHVTSIPTMRSDHRPITMHITPDVLLADLKELQPGKWMLCIATGLADIVRIMHTASRSSLPLIIACEPYASGNLAQLQELAIRLGNIRFWPLTNSDTPRFLENGDNREYASHINNEIHHLIARKPAALTISDICRPETACALLALLNSKTPITMSGHSACAMLPPFRFSQAEIDRCELECWTLTAKRGYQRGIVIPPDKYVSKSRLAKIFPIVELALLFRKQRRAIGIVVTTDELSVASDCIFQEMLNYARGIVVAARQENVKLIIRLRGNEDHAAAWNSIIATGDTVDFETQSDRSFREFAISCDMLIELGQESSAFYESAVLGTPYLRMGPVPAHRIYYGRGDDVVPQLDLDNLVADTAKWITAHWRLRAVALRQIKWVKRDLMDG
jgi:hypothetical protein